jgi:hypothetical protein
MAHKIYVDNVTVIDAATMNDVDAVVYTNSKLVTDIHTAPPKATPVDADELGIWNSVGSVLGKVTFSNLWLWIAAYTGNVTNKTFTTGNAFNGTLGATTPAAVTATTVTASGAVAGSNLSGINTGDQTALQVSNTPAGNIAATTVQAALNELDVEKANLTGAAFTGPVSSTAGDVNLKTNTALADAAATLTAAQLSGGEFTITPTVARILTLDTAANIITNLTGSVDNSNFEITIVNLAAFDVTLAAGTGVTIVGRAVINNGSATFRVRRLTATTVEVKRLEGVADVAIGVGQTWQDVAGSRAINNTVYTNNTGRPIEVFVTGAMSNGSTWINTIVGGITLQGQSITNIAGALAHTQFIVPGGNTYQCTPSSGTSTIVTWVELR